MKKLTLSSILLPMFITIGCVKPIPENNKYLGQTPPGNTPVIFKLSVTPGHFAAERITISNDDKEIYYSEIKGYYPTSGQRMKYFRYSDDKWNGPLDLFEAYCAPALSIKGDAMYFEGGTFETYISMKKGLNWSNPKRMVTKVDSAHYLQVTNKGNYYVSARLKNGIGLGDWCKLEIKGSDTTAVCLGMPLNTVRDNLDFFVATDESYMIVATPRGLGISYHKDDGSWTNPRNLGSKINFGLGAWGQYVSADNKYLFYTTGTKQDYSDAGVYWVRIDGLIDSLKNTNIPPYLKNALKVQNTVVGSLFSFTVPDDTFFDEDSNAPFTYSATLLDGSPLPLWLSFNPATKVFSGTPSEVGSLNIRFAAADTAKGTAACLLTIQAVSTQK